MSDWPIPDDYTLHPSPFLKCQFNPEGDKGGGKAALQPGEQAFVFHDVMAHPGGGAAVDHKDAQRHCHKGQAEQAHIHQWGRCVGGDELGQEGEEKDRQFGVEHIDQSGLHRNAQAVALVCAFFIDR